MMQIAICDDEKEVQKALSKQIKKLVPDVNLTCYGSGEELLSDEQQFSILFLDIQMSGVNGMETARRFREKQTQTVLIFVTAIEEYVFQAFDVGAFHYLVKPFTEERFAEIFHKVWEQAEGQNGTEAKRQEDKFIWIKTGGVSIKIPVSDIVYAEVLGKCDGCSRGLPLTLYQSFIQTDKKCGVD